MKPIITIGVDPGSEKSAVVAYNVASRRFVFASEAPNGQILEILREQYDSFYQMTRGDPATFAFGVEISVSRGQVYADHVWTFRWSGRFLQRWLDITDEVENDRAGYVHVEHVRQFLTGKRGATNAQVRQGLFERFGVDPKKRKFDESTGLNLLVGNHIIDAAAVAFYLAESERT